MKRNGNNRPFNINRVIAVTFIGIILIGTLLLCLPAASRNGKSCSFETALFTATSASCVTGLILADTWVQWSGFGQIVILCMIEIGGLGFMSAVSFVILALRKKLSMSQRMVYSQAIGTAEAVDTKQMQKRILKGSLLIEGTGALILALRFWPVYGFGKAVKLGVFHAVSAFCNAGFDIFGFETPGGSMVNWSLDPCVCITLCLLIVLGGLGFIVWDEVIRINKVSKWSVYTRLVLLTSLILTFAQFLLICLTEWNNNATLGSMPFSEKMLSALFQSVTCRTAGFAGLDQGELTEAGKAVSMFFMLIGGSSGSTAGGLKTVTFVVLFLFMWSKVRGRDTIHIFSRTISDRHVLNAVALFCAMAVLAFSGAIVICMTSPVRFTDSLYETISAIATVGLTTGITTRLSRIGKIIIMLFMYFGRVGIFTVSTGFMRQKRGENFRYAETDVLIG